MQFPRLLEKNLYLHVPFFEKDDAEAAGAKWDKDFMLWFLPPGSDPLEVRRWWSFLGNAYDDRKTIKKMGAKFNGRLESWWVPNDLNFDFVAILGLGCMGVAVPGKADGLKHRIELGAKISSTVAGRWYSDGI